MKKRAIKKYKPKKKLKITIRYSSSFLIPLFYVFLAFMFFFIIKNYSSKINFKNISITTNTINKISVNVDDNELKNEIDLIVSKWLSRLYSKDSIKELENQIKKAYPYTEISHSFNPITGSLSLNISKLKAIAKLKDEERYLLENMAISSKNPQHAQDYPIIKINQEINKETFDLFKRIINSDIIKLFDSKPLLYMDKNTLIVEYENGIKIILSNDFKPKETNISKIKDVIKDVKNKTSSFILDARYIDYGKLIVKPLQDYK